jgi:hypothetical protein
MYRKRDFVMFPVVGVDAVRCQDYRPISLVCVDSGCANTGVGIDPCQEDRVGAEAGKRLVKVGSVERAVPFLDHDNIGWSNRQLRENFAARVFPGR